MREFFVTCIKITYTELQQTSFLSYKLQKPTTSFKMRESKLYPSIKHIHKTMHNTSSLIESNKYINKKIKVNQISMNQNNEKDINELTPI